MKLSTVFSVLLVGLMSVQLGDSCGGYMRPLEPLNKITNRTTSDKEHYVPWNNYLPDDLFVKDGAQRGIDECKNQFHDEIWNCSINYKRVQKEMPIFVNRTLPYGTRETAFMHAISAAAITDQFTRLCSTYGIPGCKCSFGVTCDHEYDIAFGQNKTRLFFDKLETGNDARTAMNLHNNKVGREAVKSHSRAIKLTALEKVGEELKQKYRNAVRVFFLENKLQERIGDQFRAISSEDSRLVYLDPSPDYCVRNDTVGSYGMLGRTCQSPTDCKGFMSQCKSCKLRPKPEKEYEKIKCKCKYVLSVYKCEICTKMRLVTTCIL